MASLWDRTMTVFKSKWNQLLNRAENPNETLDYSYEKQLELLQNVKRGVADVVTAKKRLRAAVGQARGERARSSSPRRETRWPRTARTWRGWRSSARRPRRRSFRISIAR